MRLAHERVKHHLCVSRTFRYGPFRTADGVQRYGLQERVHRPLPLNIYGRWGERAVKIQAMMAFGIVSSLTISGCAPMMWDKPGASQQDFAADQYSCEKDARQSAYFGGGIIGAINMRNFYKECMVAHGYTEHGNTPLEGSPSVSSEIAQPAVSSTSSGDYGGSAKPLP